MPTEADLIRDLRAIRDTVRACRDGDLPTGAALRLIERRVAELLAQLPSAPPVSAEKPSVSSL